MVAVLRLVRLAGALSLTLSLATACAQSPVAPTRPEPPVVATPSPSPTGTLTVRVLTRGTEQPIASAIVSTVEGRLSTDASGLCTLPIVQGEEVEVNVSAPGYQPMGAAAVLTANERWTFYLQPSSDTSLHSIVVR